MMNEQPESTVWDAPNQQVVRADQSTPWDEGSGGEPEQQPAEMTKDELLAKAQELGISPANAAMTKAELKQAIEDHESGVRDS